MSDNSVVLNKKITMAPFVSYARRGHFYALLAARLELVPFKPDQDIIACFDQGVVEVGDALRRAWKTDDGREGLSTVGQERARSGTFTPVEFFRTAFGTLTASEEVVLDAISSQSDLAMMVKGLRSLSALVVGETP